MTLQPLSRSVSESKKMISEGLYQYIRKCSQINELPYQFDELFFLHVILTRYNRELNLILLSPDLEQLLSRRIFLEDVLEKTMNEKISKIHNIGLYERSQILFSFLGFRYYLKIAKRIEFDVTADFVTALNYVVQKVKGYSLIYDYMIRFFCEKLGISLNPPLLVNVMNGSREDQIYIHTHFFLVESDYFTKEISRCRWTNRSNRVPSNLNRRCPDRHSSRF